MLQCKTNQHKPSKTNTQSTENSLTDPLLDETAVA